MGQTARKNQRVRIGIHVVIVFFDKVKNLNIYGFINILIRRPLKDFVLQFHLELQPMTTGFRYRMYQFLF